MPERYKEEIEEILKQAEEVLEGERPKSSRPQPHSRRHVVRLPRIGWPSGLPRVSPGKVMLGALSLFLVAILLKATTGPVMLFVWLGLGLFVVAYAMFFARPGTPRIEKRWRGRLVEQEPTTPLGKLIRWLRG